MMRHAYSNIHLYTRLFLGAFILFSGTPLYAGSDSFSSITVLAPSSMTESMTALSRDYAVRAKVTVTTSFSTAGDLAQMIEAGEPAEIYISEDASTLTELKRKGLIDVFSVTTLVTNQLVFVMSSASKAASLFPAHSPPSFVVGEVLKRKLITMGDPDTAPSGFFAKEALEHLQLWDTVRPAIVRAGSSRDALYMIAKGNGAGIVYYSDAYNNREVRILSGFPSSSHSPIIYQAAVVAGENMEEARRFLDFLKSEEAMDIFTQHGFLPLEL